jgi:hypothetical protein
MPYSSVVENLRAVESTVMEYKIKAMVPHIDAAMKKVFNDYITTQGNIISELKDKMTSIVPSPVLKS